jgi:hypothetical protein
MTPSRIPGEIVILVASIAISCSGRFIDFNFTGLYIKKFWQNFAATLSLVCSVTSFEKVPSM